MSTPILWNTGKKQLESILQLPILALAVLAYYSFADEGVKVAAFVTAGVLITRAVVITTAACRQLDIHFSDLCGSVQRGLAMVAIASLSGAGGLELGRGAVSSSLGALIGGVSVGIFALIATSVFFPKLLGAAAIEMLGRFSPAVARLLNKTRSSHSGAGK
jgi:PST family polysaccharide transporter